MENHHVFFLRSINELNGHLFALLNQGKDRYHWYHWFTAVIGTMGGFDGLFFHNIGIVPTYLTSGKLT